MMPIFEQASLVALVVLSIPLAAAATLTTATTAPAPKSKPDLRCELVAWGGGNTAVANGGSAKPIVGPNGVHSMEYVLTVKNVGGATAAPFVVRYDYITRVGGHAFTSSKPDVPWGAMAAGQEFKGPRLKLSGSPPFPNTHEITVTLDTQNKIAESNEANNTCKLAVIVK